MQLRRSGAGRQIVWVVLLLPVVAACGAVLALAVGYVSTLRRVGAHSFMASRGPVRVDGFVGKREPVAAPSGARGPGWLAWIAQRDTDSKGRARYRVLCSRADLHDLPFGDLGGTTLDLVAPGDPVEGVPGGGLDVASTSPRPRVQIGSGSAGKGASTTIPQAMLAACAREIAGVDASTLRYGERVLHVGDRAELLACKDGARFVPCHDGVDAFATGGIVAGTGGDAFLFAVAQVFALMMMGSVGAAMTSKVVRLRREPW